MKKNLFEIEELAIEPLTDEELELVDGGATDTQVASCSCCCVGCTGPKNTQSPQLPGGGNS